MSQENVNDCFSNRLRELMRGQNVTQEQLAEYVGATRQSIGLYTSGKRAPDIHVLKRIAEYFNISADYLLGLEVANEDDSELSDLLKKARPFSIGLCKRFDESLNKTEKALQYSSYNTELDECRWEFYEWLFHSISTMISDYDELIEKFNGTFSVEFRALPLSFEEVVETYQELISDMQGNNNKLLSLLCKYRERYTER